LEEAVSAAIDGSVAGSDHARMRDASLGAVTGVKSAPASVPVKRLRLRVNPQDRAFVEVQGSTKRSFRPFAQAFGGSANRRAALIVESVNSHSHMIKTLRAVQRMSQLPVSDSDRQRTRLALIARHVTTALAQVGE
jgi:hypothetical protein